MGFHSSSYPSDLVAVGFFPLSLSLFLSPPTPQLGSNSLSHPPRIIQKAKHVHRKGSSEKSGGERGYGERLKVIILKSRLSFDATYFPFFFSLFFILHAASRNGLPVTTTTIRLVRLLRGTRQKRTKLIRFPTFFFRHQEKRTQICCRDLLRFFMGVGGVGGKRSKKQKSSARKVSPG